MLDRGDRSTDLRSGQRPNLFAHVLEIGSVQGHGRRQGGGPSCTMKPWKGCSGTMFISLPALADIALSRCPQNSQLGPTDAHCLRLPHSWSC